MGSGHRVEMLDKDMSHVLGGMEQDLRDFITLLRMVNNLKLMHCLLLEFSTYYFWTAVDRG